MPLQWPEPEQCRHLAPGPGVFQLGVSVEPLGALRPNYATSVMVAVPYCMDCVSSVGTYHAMRPSMPQPLKPALAKRASAK